MLEAWVALGFRKVITTPHVISALYPNTAERILGQMYALREKIGDWGLGIELEASAEYHLDYEFMGRVEREEVIPFGDRNYLLLELPFQQPSYSIEQILYDVQLAGYEPIIAHPERHNYLSAQFSKYEKLKDRGTMMQLNLNSLNGLYGVPARKAAEKLIDAGMIDLVGSDAHHVAHLVDLRKLLRNKYFLRVLESGNLKNSEL